MSALEPGFYRKRREDSCPRLDLEGQPQVSSCLALPLALGSCCGLRVLGARPPTGSLFRGSLVVGFGGRGGRESAEQGEGKGPMALRMSARLSGHLGLSGPGTAALGQPGGKVALAGY